MREWTKQTPGARIRIIAGPYYGKLAVTRCVAGIQTGDKVHRYIEAVLPKTGTVVHLEMNEAVLALDEPKSVPFTTQNAWNNVPTVGFESWDD